MDTNAPWSFPRNTAFTGRSTADVYSHKENKTRMRSILVFLSEHFFDGFNLIRGYRAGDTQKKIIDQTGQKNR